ncbi:MAG: DUF349 domain-containing protein, partial [Bacteroidales bacterium]|nr:DUF349 domain-containing protein [Bacteroidales bacterium]
QKKQNFEKKLAVMKELRQLVESESADNLKEIYDAFNTLKDRWKEIGAVPMEKNNDLWMNYNVLVEKFFNKVRMFRDMRDLDMQKNLELKIQLCENMEDLLLEKSFNKSFQMLKEYWEKWQEIGPVPIDKKDEIWDRFKAATDAVHQKRREFFASQQDELNNNLLAKNALIDKMKEISEKEINSIKEWTASDKEVNEVFELWKSIGRVGQKNEDIWEDFRNLRSNYFTKRREFFGEIREKQNQNLNAKINLCIQAEAIAERNDWKKATEELLALQEEWKSIGYVPTAKVDAVWKRFRAAFDTFFDKKKAHFASQSSSEKDNLALKKVLIDELLTYQENGNRQEQLDMVKQFQKRWTEIGHVPMSQKDKIYEEFRAAIDNLMEKFKINPAELRENAFVKRYAGIQTADDAKNISNKEAFALKKKIEDLKNNISTYENNMGFLLKSKNMEVLRKEYEDKILKMKQEVALFEAKLKLILA